MYTNIPKSEGIKAVKTSLDNSPRKAITAKVITVFPSLILTLNNFLFNCKDCIQINGCVIGTIFAPPSANIFMDHFHQSI